MKKLTAISVFAINICFFAFLYSRHLELTQEIPKMESEVTEKTEIEVSEIVPEFIDVPEFRNNSEQSVYGDVMRHSQEIPFGDGSGNGRSTNVHETAHGIHSYIRNKYTLELGKRVNAFYALEGRGVIIEEPKIRKNHIKGFIPECLKSFRYSLYIEGSQVWDDRALYIYDEWTAYVLEGKCSIDDVQNDRYQGGWTAGVSGCLDFSIYSIALSMAVKDGDPNYWNNNKQFRDYTIWNLREAYKTYIVGHKMEQFKWDKQDALLKEFITNPAAESMRNFVRENLEGVWLDVNSAEFALIYKPYQCKILQVNESVRRR